MRRTAGLTPGIESDKIFCSALMIDSPDLGSRKMPDRSDYDAIFDKDGPDGLTAAVRQRFNPMLADREFRRMAHREFGRWIVAIDSGGDPHVIGRRDPGASHEFGSAYSSWRSF